MTKSELIAFLAEENPHLYQRDVERIVTTIFDEIAAARCWMRMKPRRAERLMAGARQRAGPGDAGHSPLRALGHHRHASEFAREHFNDQAGFLIRIAVQHVTGLVPVPNTLGRHGC